MRSRPIDPVFRDDALGIMNALVSGDLARVFDRLEPGLTLDYVAEALSGSRKGGEVLVPVTDAHLSRGFQLGDRASAEVFLPFDTPDGQADLELRLATAPDGRLLITDVVYL